MLWVARGGGATVKPARSILLGVLSHRTLALLRWDLHFLRVRIRNALSGANQKVRTRAATAPRPRYLNLGSGPRGLNLPNWVNVDGFADTHVHHLADFGRSLPFADCTFDGVFSEHVLEHFTRDEGIFVFRECHRILASGGLIRVIVPDAGKVVSAYVEHPDLLSKRREPPTGLAMEAVNFYAYQRYEHQCLYDWPLMHRTLADAGFADIERRSFGEGAIPALTIDDSKYEWESLYVEAKRR